MISPALCPTLTLLLIIGVIFSVSLTENLQLADGFTSVTVRLVYEMQLGETQFHTWSIINDDQKKPLYLEMYATGQGSELFIFEEDIVIEPGAMKDIEIFVQVPDDYPTDLELRPLLYAKKINPPTEQEASGAKLNIIMQQLTKPRIYIGDNPVYYPPEVIEKVLPTPVPTNTNAPAASEVETIPGETMQEKLDRIKAANLVDQIDTPQVTATDKPEIKDDAYTPEPVMDAEPTDLPKCGFWEMILSWFGIKSDCI